VAARRGEIADLVGSADLMSLLCAVAHLTGDFDLLRPEFTPDQLQLLLPSRGLSEADEEAARAALVAALSDFEASGRVPHVASADELRLMFGFLIGASSVSQWWEFLMEELALPGSDPRAPSWHLDEVEVAGVYRCAIVGAGVSGLATAHRLRQAGIDVTIFEKNDDVGGTWLENVYPGCRVDVPNHLYSFSFRQRDDWPGRFSAQPDLLEYVQQAVHDLRLRDCISFSTEVTSARFVESSQEWDLEVTDADGVNRTERFSFFICSTGQLNRPSFPDIAGRDEFAGSSFHSAAWDHSVDLTGKRVAVIGTGASAVQFVPHVAESAAQVDIFQRTAPWMLPTENYREAFPLEYFDLLQLVPTFGRWDRIWQFWLMHEGLLPTAKVDPEWSDTSLSVSASNLFVREMLLELLRSQVPDEELYQKMVPQFPPFSKRGLRDDGLWAATLNRPNVTVNVEPIDVIIKEGVRTKDGVVHQADVLIYGTGFSASKFLTPMRVFGRGGIELNEQWDGDARAYLGISVPHFPNFFMLYGPNTNLVVNGSIIVIVECQVRFIVEALGQLIRSGYTAMDCRLDVHDRYNEEIDAGNLEMAWGVAKVPSWYRNAKGRVTQNWPFSLWDYWNRTRVPDLKDYELTR
jgi:4-hydroxyacetophenone monooxygenase